MALIYLASPYSVGGASLLKMNERFEEVAKWAANLMAKGYLVLSPITHSHPIAMASGNTLSASDWEVWKALDFAMLDRCQELWVCHMGGWKESVGIRDEVVKAQADGKPCYIVMPTLKIYRLSISDEVYRIHYGEPRK